MILARNRSAPSDKKSIIHKRSDFVKDHFSSFFSFDVQILNVLLEAKPPTVTAREWQSCPKYCRREAVQMTNVLIYYHLIEEMKRARETKFNEIERETGKNRRFG